MNPLAVIGSVMLDFMASTGRLAVFTANGVRHCFMPPVYLRLVLRQMLVIGYFSLPVVGLTALFTGMVLALQIYIGSARFNAESAVATIVVIGITRELGPVLGGLMVAGRVASAMAAEIGTMRVTEQIDALTTLPILIVVADIIGVMGGYLVGTAKLGFNPAVYLKNTYDFLQTLDVVSGLVKAGVFGFIIALMGCYNGFHSKGGAQGVGKATTDAVVTASILILTANYFVTELFFATK